MFRSCFCSTGSSAAAKASLPKALIPAGCKPNFVSLHVLRDKFRLLKTFRPLSLQGLTGQRAPCRGKRPFDPTVAGPRLHRHFHSIRGDVIVRKDYHREMGARHTNDAVESLMGDPVAEFMKRS